MISNKKLLFWIENNFNVLFEGKHGVGKTAIILDAFRQSNLKYLYFSSSTLDPFIDFCGVPIKVEENGKSVIKLILPEHIDPETTEAIFLDEYNRCLTGDTVIPLIDENPCKIKDLVGRESFYVFSYNIKKNRVETARGHSARLTGRKPIYHIKLKNSEHIIKCTSNHPFLLAKEKPEYVKAEDLKINDSLLTLNFENANIKLDDFSFAKKTNSFYQKNGHHIIESIEIKGEEDVYDISVNKFHNFALESGIFVHNSHKKVRNATMELIQFKTINGRSFPKLKVVWVAINPESEGDEQVYDVEKLDPAQKDRFHVHVQIPYKCNKSYFSQKYGEKIAKASIEWWEELPDIIKDQISPRRLDYALEMNIKNGDIDDVLPKSSNTYKLKKLITYGPMQETINEIFENKDVAKANRIIDDCDYQEAIKISMYNNQNMTDFFLPLFSNEILMSFISAQKKSKYKDFFLNIILFDIKDNYKESKYFNFFYNAYKTTMNEKLKETFRKTLIESRLLYSKKIEKTTLEKLPIHDTNKTLEECKEGIKLIFGTYSYNVAKESLNFFYNIKNHISLNIDVDSANSILSSMKTIAIKAESDIIKNNHFPELHNVVTTCVCVLLFNGISPNKIKSDNYELFSILSSDFYLDLIHEVPAFLKEHQIDSIEKLRESDKTVNSFTDLEISLSYEDKIQSLFEKEEIF